LRQFVRQVIGVDTWVEGVNLSSYLEMESKGGICQCHCSPLAWLAIPPKMVASTTNPPSDEEIGDKKYPADSVINCLLQMHQLTAKPKENPCPYICPICVQVVP
jgi:hypothetical protein